jgi:hypothetical protein
LEGENFSVSPTAIPSMSGQHGASLLGLVGPATRTDARKGKRTFSNFNAKDNISYWGKNFQTESIISVIRDDTLLDNRTGWIYEDMSEIMMTWLKSRQIPCTVLARNQ